MLRQLRLQRFKRFRDETIPVAPLTLLTGFNSGGKSSTLQSLLFLQNALATGTERAGTLAEVPLNGPNVHLGDVRTVVNEFEGGQSFALEVSDDTTRLEWTFGRDDWPRECLSIPVSEVRLQGSVLDEARTLVPREAMRDPGARSLLRSIERLQFVPADRLGPAETYRLEHPEQHTSPGTRAENTFGNLVWLGRDERWVPPFKHPSPEVPPMLLHQTEAWLGEMFPGVVLDPRRVEHANLMTLGIRTDSKLNYHRPQNVGFGVTYALPVILAILCAPPGGVVIVENPESHLHPRAQAQLARFCAQAAHAGVQVLVETHSDHILNGIRVAVARQIVGPTDVSILFYDGASGDMSARVTQRIEIDRRGRLDRWPEGFFDEGDRLLDRLLESGE